MCALFTPERDETNDIMKTIKSCIKDAKKCKIRHAIKMITQLVVVSKYTKLCAQYSHYPSNWPFLVSNSHISIHI
jgi:hypothetical protein